MPETVRCLCIYCSKPADMLMYYTKEYPAGTGRGTRSTLESPVFCCEGCSARAHESLNVCRGGIEGVVCHTFRQLGMMREKEVGYLTSRRGWESNDLATKEYRQLLFSLHYRNRPSKLDLLRASLDWAEKKFSDDEETLGLIGALRLRVQQ